jgi:hypothetical protein
MIDPTAVEAAKRIVATHERWPYSDIVESHRTTHDGIYFEADALGIARALLAAIALKGGAT